MTINNAANRNQVGATLLEILMVLGVVATIVIGALAFFQQTSTANKVQTEVKNVGAVVSGIEQMFSTQGSYAGLTNAAIYNANFVPENMKGAATPTLLTQWKSAATVAVIAAPPAPAPANSQFTITLAAIPSAPCKDLANAVYKQFRNTAIGATNILPTNAAATAAISTACDTAATVNIVMTR